MIEIDIHSHILPGVDDGAQSFEETIRMMKAARRAGVKVIIATPHYKSATTDIASIHRIYKERKSFFEVNRIHLALGFECHYKALDRLFYENASAFSLAGTTAMLLEYSSHYLPQQWEITIAELQQGGLDIIIAHPERYAFIQEDIAVARRMREIGCELQISARGLLGGVLSSERRCAMTLLNNGLVSYIASDAHCAEDYRQYAQVYQRYSHRLQAGRLYDKDWGLKK